MSEGIVFWRGASWLTGAPIVAIATGLDGSSANPKTGPIVQTWVLRTDLPPQEAKRQNLDDAVCGNCKLRGHEGVDSICYVPAWLGPTNVYKALLRGDYLEGDARDLAVLAEDRTLRLAAYGDPAAVPIEVWTTALELAAGHVAYTHQWRTCDVRFRQIAMASVDTVDERHAAHLAGWRTFRMRGPFEPLLPGEFVCPASDEGEHRTTCEHCQLCRGGSSLARDPAIIVHGKTSSLVAFYRSQEDAQEATWD